MKLIVGLGNIGAQYHATRHNLGFAVVDMLAITYGRQPGDFKKHSKAPAEVLDLKSEYDCMLVKPTTMMNLSGDAVGALVRFYKVDPSNVWLMYDDVDLPLGRLRVRMGGGDAGHNGVKSVIHHIGDGFWRLRFGIANEFLAKTPTDKFVLDPFMQTEEQLVEAVLAAGANYLEKSLEAGNLTDQTLSL